MVGWHYRLDGHEFEQALGDGEGQGSLVCCSPWGPKELDTTELINKRRKKKAKQRLDIVSKGPSENHKSSQKNIRGGELAWRVWRIPHPEPTAVLSADDLHLFPHKANMCSGHIPNEQDTVDPRTVEA